MLRELLIPVAEALFWLTRGELLINTLWFLPWIVLWALIIAMPIFYVAHIQRGNITTHWPAIVFLVMFFPSLMIVVTPGIIQMQMMQDCRTVSAEVTIEGVTESQNVRQCRVKKNFYDTEYGPWEQVKG